MNDPMNMSIEEILAACRQRDRGEGQAAGTAPSDAPSAKSAKPSTAEPSGPAGAGQAATEAGPKKQKSAGPKAGAMTVQQMLAAARAEQAGSGAPAAAEKAAEPVSPAKGAAKGSARPTARAKRGGAMDTGSILAAARKSVRPGPVSKAAAAASGQVLPAAAKEKRKLEVAPIPEKPRYARPAPPAEPREGRRSFLASLAGVFFGSSLAVGFTALAFTHVLWAMGLARFMFPNILIEPPTKFKVGFPGDFAPGQVETKFKAQFGVWIVRYEYEGQPQIYALQTVCTHLGCTPNWLEGEQKFKCPCHGSGFYKDGVNFEGPAPRPLERFAIHIADDGQLEVDKSRRFLEEKGEWKDPASYVPV